jgi:hypothetical protein
VTGLLCPASGEHCTRNCGQSPENPALAGLCERLGFTPMTAREKEKSMEYPEDGTPFELDDATVQLLYRAVRGETLTGPEQREAVRAVDYVSAAFLYIEPEEEEDEAPVYDDNDTENPYPRDRDDGEGIGPLPSYGD